MHLFMELLPVVDIIEIGCVCSELRYFSLNNDPRKQKLAEEFDYMMLNEYRKRAIEKKGEDLYFARMVEKEKGNVSFERYHPSLLLGSGPRLPFRLRGRPHAHCPVARVDMVTIAGKSMKRRMEWHIQDVDKAHCTDGV
ncbi:hypothetical protein HHK36_009727 [Tetracentron sinense]|uniref:Uncharacterized protein n=1 Tax=Tetracentron sinense TaxID=13715 RepID=A0A835DHR9_TETSI|nr:hypothetical protein HHK36_009727 [Tetracentron sinense]